MKKIFVTIIALVMNVSSLYAYNFDLNQFNADRSTCFRTNGNVNCFRNLMTKYFYADKYYLNILRYDCGLILEHEKRYKEALLEFDYILQNEKRNTKLIALTKQEKQKTSDILKKIEDAKRNDYGDYYDYYNSAAWENPKDIKVYINNAYARSYGKSYIYQKAFQIWEDSLEGLIHFNFVSNPEEADIICDIVTKVDVNVNGRTYYGNLTEKNGKKYFQKVRMFLSNINDMGADNTNSIILTTALHEIGHALGIKYHSNSINDIMYYEIHSYRTDTLSKRDINTVKKIYGSIY